jgi:alkanesulfonate monooxygenase SsuD/methylene tetrahydromethanopterin reductase-like flavin-dependent oxidoreductase (luciferase family)
VIFGSSPDLELGKSFYADVKGRMETIGRNRDHLKVLPGAFVVVGDTVEQAKTKRAHLDSLVHYESAIASLSIALGHDASGFDPDAPLPRDIPDTNASKTGRAHVLRLAEREGLTVRQLAQRYGGYSGLSFVGTPATIADEMETWLFENGCDGFNVVFPFLPQGLTDVTEKLVPELQRRGLFRREYEGATLRDHLGLPRPVNRFFDNIDAAQIRN